MSFCPERFSTRDPLTGLLNCRGLLPWLERAAAESRSRQVRWTLCYLNIDHFWALNDKAGQAGGDALLCQVAEVLRRQVRPRDILARLEADEFVILLPHSSAGRGQRLARELRREIESLDFHWQDCRYSVTASFGVSPATAAVPDPATLLQWGDDACFIARRRGGNRVHVQSEGGGCSNRHAA